MALVHLFDNFIGPPSLGGGFAVSFEIGNKWVTDQAGSVTKLRWYAPNTTTTDKPTALRIWDTTTTTIVATAPSVPHNGTQGWQSVSLTSAFTPVVGREYVVAAGLPVGAHIAFSTSVPQPPAPLAIHGTAGVQSSNGGSGLYPANAAAQYWFVDLEFDTSFVPSPEGGQALVGDLDLVEASWHSTDANDHPTTSATYKGWQNTVDIAAGINVAGGASGATIGGIAAWVWANRDSLLWAYNQLRGHFAATPDATYPEIDTNVLTLLSRTGTLVSDNTSIMAALLNIQDDLSKLVHPPAPASWVLQDETDFDTSLAWNVPADVYTVSFSDLGSGIVNTSIGGSADVSYRLAWWAPWNGSASRDRRFIDFPEAQLYDGGIRMPGVVLFSQQGAQGHIQAWTFS